MAFTSEQVNIYKKYLEDSLPIDHYNYINNIINYKYNFRPNVIYDIGCSILPWTNGVKKIWPTAEIILFDAVEEFEFLYQGYKYNIGVLGDEDNKYIDFYKSVENYSGNSYYREKDHPEIYNDNTKFRRKMSTVDTIVSEKKFPLPDLVKLDVQGCELDILKGMRNTLVNCEHLIVELQHVEYNIGAPLNTESVPFIESLGFKLVTPLFTNNYGVDGDYHFIRATH